ncbi:type I pullulanase [Cytobacillus purgationiresistens]|uniref:Pullulanase n=1 Tax=Cytobacillus purgationiresistens TaxID=863449 RepID=A0ABU0ALT1_9BACI|nr:type I pullulanase [Cytobacillus purgationiresistens]MDQ0272228.1 pullulanase [Cytobacillus purgationiresistens]
MKKGAEPLLHVIKRSFFSYLDEMQLITILMPFDNHHGQSAFFTLIHAGVQTPLNIIGVIEIENNKKYICSVEEEIIFGNRYWIMNEHGEKTDLQIGAVIRTSAFDESFFYEGELGVSYENSNTLFRLWAPTATDVKLLLQSPVQSVSKKVNMKRCHKGVWEITEQGDLDLWRYTYHTCVNLEWREAVDPYAIAVTVNGKQGVIIDKEKTKKQKRALPHLNQPTDSIIYETHIRDLTIHQQSGACNKGTYLGASELGTTNQHGLSTGLSYIKELGVTHIEFLPMNDFEGVDERKKDGQYNWGYNPLHYNVPEGSYSIDPSDPYSRIIELKAMIDTIHSEGIRVIMDVVYNHVFMRERSSFEKIVPGYFFRHDENGMPSNGTGVGNDMASERLMVRKFIVDSITYWLKEYHVDGFRFDLMGIHDVETMNKVREAADLISPSILIIGEGWDLNTPINPDRKANISNQAQMPRIAQFNDWFRDTIKGNTFNLYDRGYALGNDFYYDAVKQVVKGSIGEHGVFQHPIQTVNYVEVHDNHTLWDKIDVCFPHESDKIKQSRHRLATSLVLLAQGIPFLHSGQEFFRTKQGNGNSYKSPDHINRLDWDARSKFKGNIDYMKGLIQLRKKYPLFRMTDANQIKDMMTFLHVEKPMVAFLLQGEGYEGKIIVYLNPTNKDSGFILPGGGWQLLANEVQAGIKPIHSYAGKNELTIKALSIQVFIQCDR